MIPFLEIKLHPTNLFFLKMKTVFQKVYGLILAFSSGISLYWKIFFVCEQNDIKRQR